MLLIKCSFRISVATYPLLFVVCDWPVADKSGYGIGFDQRDVQDVVGRRKEETNTVAHRSDKHPYLVLLLLISGKTELLGRFFGCGGT